MTEINLKGYIIMNVENKIKEVLDGVRPFLQQDGGDVSFVKFEEGIVYVRMQGACAGCAAIDATLYDDGR